MRFRALIAWAICALLIAVPAQARFLQVDPVGYDDQVNLYAYVDDDPVNRVDPSGNEGASCYGPSLCGNTQISPKDQATENTILKGTAVAVGAIAGFVASGGEPLGAVEGAHATLMVIDAGTKGSDHGCVYCVSGDKTKSGKQYVGTADDLKNRARNKSDGRDRKGAEIVGSYPKGDRQARQNAEQGEMNKRGGVGNLDNKRNEVAPKNWGDRGIRSPKEKDDL